MSKHPCEGCRRWNWRQGGDGGRPAGQDLPGPAGAGNVKDLIEPVRQDLQGIVNRYGKLGFPFVITSMEQISAISWEANRIGSTYDAMRRTVDSQGGGDIFRRFIAWRKARQEAGQTGA